MASPIADLTYRNYDGPLLPPSGRWWVIAKTMMRLGIKKKGFWWWALLSAYMYAVMLIVFYAVDQLGAMSAPGSDAQVFFRSVIWKDVFLFCLGSGQVFLLILTLLLGSASIAGDNKANALLVYLSKPCTKRDYIIGKWFAIYLPLMLVTLVPALVFYGYCFLAYRNFGVVSQEPWLLPKIILMAQVPGVLHASLMVGVSSLFNQARLAGAVYAGIYFLTGFFGVMIFGITQSLSSSGGRNALTDNLAYLSVDGLIQGVSKWLLDTQGSNPFEFGRRASSDTAALPPPVGYFILPAFAIVCLLGIWVAWRKVRAVEVVGS
ncbi:MAG: ABC transporter permease [Fimbriimonadaceae bacterium]